MLLFDSSSLKRSSFFCAVASGMYLLSHPHHTLTPALEQFNRHVQCCTWLPAKIARRLKVLFLRFVRNECDCECECVFVCLHVPCQPPSIRTYIFASHIHIRFRRFVFHFNVFKHKLIYVMKRASLFRAIQMICKWRAIWAITSAKREKLLLFFSWLSFHFKIECCVSVEFKTLFIVQRVCCSRRRKIKSK